MIEMVVRNKESINIKDFDFMQLLLDLRTHLEHESSFICLNQ
jgi:hypothetical protein